MALVATLGLALHMLMAATLLYTAQAASNVASAATNSHVRTREFSELQFAADRYHRAAYMQLSQPNEVQARELSVSAADFRRVVRNIAELPPSDADERRANQNILALAESVQRMIDLVPSSFRRVNEEWGRNGSIGASAMSQQLSKPYFDLVAALRHELAVSNAGLRKATGQVNFLRGLVVPVASFTLFLLFLCTITVFLLIVLRLSPALRRLDMGVRAFADGETNHRIAVDGHDEFGRLAGSFNVMTEQIDRQQRRLQNAAADLERAVEKRTAQLELANEELAAVDQRRRIFFAEVSHELRTPITIIQGEAQLALRQMDGISDFATDGFIRIFGQARELGRVIDDLFLIARAEADGLDLHFADVKVEEVIDQVADAFHAVASDCDVKIESIASPDLYVHADAGRLRQVISAALDNAIRHGGVSIEVCLAARRRDDFVEISVMDNGVGVPPAQLDLLLQRFRRGATTAEGSGLGFTIIRALTEAQGGTVRLSNRSTGGLEVIISLPATKAPHYKGEGRLDVISVAGGGRDEGF